MEERHVREIDSLALHSVQYSLLPVKDKGHEEFFKLFWNPVGHF